MNKECKYVGIIAFAEGLKQQRDNQYDATDAVLCPLLPSVKRNKDNRLAMSLEDNETTKPML